VKGWERLPRDEIVTRACQAVAAVAHEKSRNAELVYRLQQTHEEGIEAKQLKSRYAELQVAPILLAPAFALPKQGPIQGANTTPQYRNMFLLSPDASGFRFPLLDGCSCKNIDVLGSTRDGTER
jgi:hypothetical protein